MHGPINVKSPKNISKWQMGFNSAFKGLKVSVNREEFLKLLGRTRIPVISMSKRRAVLET
jgi:hypothetical protein